MWLMDEIQERVVTLYIYTVFSKDCVAVSLKKGLFS